jgi:hypothetical protein
VAGGWGPSRVGCASCAPCRRRRYRPRPQVSERGLTSLWGASRAPRGEFCVFPRGTQGKGVGNIVFLAERAVPLATAPRRWPKVPELVLAAETWLGSLPSCRCGMKVCGSSWGWETGDWWWLENEERERERKCQCDLRQAAAGWPCSCSCHSFPKPMPSDAASCWTDKAWRGSLYAAAAARGKCPRRGTGCGGGGGLVWW